MPAQNISLLTLCIAATAGITADRFITYGGATTGLAGHAAGVAKSAGSSGDLIPVDVIGTAVVEAGAAVAAGALVQSDASGRAITAVASALKSAVIAGGDAGPLTVTGIATTDRLVSVTVLDRNATAANITLANLTPEFSISGADTITNLGGTATTGDALLVVYETANPVRGRALEAASGIGAKFEIQLFNN